MKMWRTLIAFAAVAALAGPAFAAEISDTSSTNHDIPVTPAPGGELYAPISITGAPAGAVIESITVEWDIDHNWIQDVDIKFGTNTWSSDWMTLTVTGDHILDGYDESSEGIATYYPPATQAVNQTWFLVAKDTFMDGDDLDEGRLDWWKITITYTDAACGDLGYPLGECDSVDSDGSCQANFGQVWECVDAGAVDCWVLREDCAQGDVCHNALGTAATCLTDGDAEYCAAWATAGSGCLEGESDCDGDGECLGDLECQGPTFGGQDGCCPANKEWSGTACVAVDCASLGYPLGECGVASSDGECEANYGQVWQCTDVGDNNCWVLAETCDGDAVCHDPLTGAATCIAEGHADFCSALQTAGSGCAAGQSDCDGDGECLGDLECKGPLFGGQDGCCPPGQDWTGSECVSQDCATLGYPLGPCGIASSDGECTADGSEVWKCVDAGPVNCWLQTDTCSGGSSVCFDGLVSGAGCVSNGHEDYCDGWVDAGSGCIKGESDCDTDGDCLGDLVCQGPIGGGLDGCCAADEQWDGTQCAPGDCAGLGYPLGACGLTSNDGECAAAGTEVWHCVDAGPVNCWSLTATCDTGQYCHDGLVSGAGCIGVGDEDYCSAKAAAGVGCGEGEGDCDGDGECAAGLECQGPIGGPGNDGCCDPADEWSGTECLPKDCGALGYPLGGCGITSNDGECGANGGQVWHCVDAGPVNCWSLTETCGDTQVCFDGLVSGAGCIDDGDEDYCAAWVDAGSGCIKGESDCDSDSECLGNLECKGPIGQGLDGCCAPDEEWDGSVCIPGDCAANGYPLGACGLVTADGECAPDGSAVWHCVNAGPLNCWSQTEACGSDQICFDGLVSGAGCLDPGENAYCSAKVDAGKTCDMGEGDCDSDSECAPGLECQGPIGPFGGIDGCCPPALSWDGTSCTDVGPCGDGVCSAASAETCASCPGDCGGPCCGNGTCQPEFAETCSSCEQDCGACPTGCGDGTCQANENCATCAADCGQCCGNGVCQSAFGETCQACAADCGACPAACGDGTCDAATEDCASCPVDCGPCCGNGQCEASKGESCSFCPADCGACPAMCGDGTCNGTENCANCAADCGGCCGDGACTASWGEDCVTCTEDCGACPATCGDGVCGTGEGCANCAADCGECCGNGTCEFSFGENCVYCPDDCGACPSTCGDGTCGAGETCATCSDDCGACCGNDKCEPSYGETCANCSADCDCAPTGCGNGTCDAGEDCATCGLDCGVCCGDGTCSPERGEDCLTCAADCGDCGATCGDGTCEGAEYCGSCPADCGGPCGCGDGVCGAGEDCTSCAADCGACPCQPTCGDKVCGDNGCGGSCGTCGTGTKCNVAGQCEATGPGPDAGSTDTGTPDSGPGTDAAVSDNGPTPVDAGSTNDLFAPTVDTGPSAASSSDGCSTGGAGRALPLWLLLAAALGALVLRRRQRYRVGGAAGTSSRSGQRPR